MKYFFLLIPLLFFYLSCNSSGLILERDKLMKEKEKYIIENKKIEEELKVKNTFIKIYTDFQEEIDNELNKFDLGFITLSSNEIEFQNNSDKQKTLIEKLQRIYNLIEKNRYLLSKLKLAEAEVKRFDKIVYKLQQEVEIRKCEILRLTESKIDIKKRNVELMDKNLSFKEEIIKLKFKNIKLKNEINILKDNMNSNVDIVKNKYIIRITEKDLNWEQYDNSLIEISGKNLKILSKHKEGSFKINDIIKEELCVLEIIDQDLFWCKCRFLILLYE